MIYIIFRYRRILVVGVHIVLIVLANYLAFWLRFDGAIPSSIAALMIQTLPWLVVIRALTFMHFRLYEGLWRYTGIWDLKNIIFGVTASSVGFLIIAWAVGLAVYPRSVLVIDSLLLIFLMGGIRLARRLYQW